ncbi:FG-GAP-like repeat-containing protein [Kitasatospora sp. NPDC127067]|uniref:FG-GAP-like repeat-containing protein n=1 Tax=Kitasatospora sp. NPDC127067 TaxID=3347126 RepID=UPI00364E1D43
MKTTILRLRRIRAALTVVAMTLTGLTVSVGQASAQPYYAFEIQNQATGLCIEGSSDLNPYQMELHPCGSSGDQWFGVRNHNTLVDLNTGGSCLATDSYGNALSVGCATEGYNPHWTFGSTTGDWTTISSPNGCYLKILNGQTPACMPGFQGSNAQWRMIRRVPDHHAGTDAGTGRVKWADFDGDGKADYITVGSNGAVNVWLNRGGDTGGGWDSLGQVASGVTTDATRVRFADFDGDGLADYICINADGSVQVYLNRGGDGHGGWQPLGQVASGLTTDPSRVRLADIDGDGKADYSAIGANGSISTYLNRGGDGHGGWADYGQIATGTTTDQNAVVLADFTGDHKVDYITTNPNNSVSAYRNDGGDGHGGWTSLGQVAAGA